MSERSLKRLRDRVSGAGSPFKVDILVVLAITTERLEKEQTAERVNEEAQKGQLWRAEIHRDQWM